LTEHIEATLPQVKTMVLNEIRQTKAELELWGGSYTGMQLSSPKDKGWMLLQMLNNFAIDFRDAVQGHLPTLSTGELYEFHLHIKHILNLCILETEERGLGTYFTKRTASNLIR